MNSKTCQRCGYQWEPRKDNPKACPMCHSYKWRIAADVKTPVRNTSVEYPNKPDVETNVDWGA